MKVAPERPGDDVIDNDMILVWGAQKRIITGSDLLGRLLRGIATVDLRSERRTVNRRRRTIAFVRERGPCSPLPLVGRGRGWGSRDMALRSPQLLDPPPRPSPTRGEGEDGQFHCG